MKRTKVFTGVVALGVGTVVALFVFGGNEPKTTFTPLAIEPSIIEAGRASGITEDQLREVKAQYGSGPCKEAAIGCYNPTSRTVYVEPDTATGVPNTLAYEYMHDTWSYRLNQEQKTSFRPILEQLSNQPSFQTSLKELQQLESFQGDIFYNEMFSNACVRFRDDELPQPLLDTCNEYLPERANLQRYF